MINISDIKAYSNIINIYETKVKHITHIENKNIKLSKHGYGEASNYSDYIYERNSIGSGHVKRR